jgi:DNA-binding winged helix-turn-helix (wHTH) protein
VRVRFAEFTFDSDARQLVRGEGEVHLSTRAFDLLRTLLEHRPDVVDKSELYAQLWPDTFVVEANLNVLIAEIRRALADTPQNPRFIRTVHGVGYAFCGKVTDVSQKRSSRPAASVRRFWLVWKDRTMVLSNGENIVGRDPQCDVWLDASGVSRRHARIRISALTDTVLLEDLGSKNGTFVRNARVSGQQRLVDGDVVHVGSVELTFREWLPDKPKETERIRRP